MRLFIIVQNVQIQKRYHVLIPPSHLFWFPKLDAKGLLHVGSIRRLGRHGLALDALSTGVVVLGVLADVGRAGVRSDRRLTGALSLSVSGSVLRAETVLLGLLLLELLAGTGAAAG